MQLGTIVTRYIFPSSSLFSDQKFVNYFIISSNLWSEHVSLVSFSCSDTLLSILQWAEVLSADAFSAFEDAGLDNSKVSMKELDSLASSIA